MNKYIKYACIASLSLSLSGLFASCSDDDNPEEPTSVTTNFSGTLSSSIPAFPDFAPVPTDNNVTMQWQSADKNHINLSISAFSLTVANMGMNVEIGQMDIENITIQYDDKNFGIIPETEFECMAGKYETKGTISGSYDTPTGELTLTLDYKPGSMPFSVHSEYKGTRKSN